MYVYIHYMDADTIVRVRSRIRMCKPSRPFMRADTYVREGRHVRMCKKQRITVDFPFHCSVLGISLQWNFFTLLWILFQCPGLCLLDHLLVCHDCDLHTAIQGTSLRGAVVGNWLMNTFALEDHTIRTDALVH